jgi:hypothetical protein
MTEPRLAPAKNTVRNCAEQCTTRQRSLNRRGMHRAKAQTLSPRMHRATAHVQARSAHRIEAGASTAIGIAAGAAIEPAEGNNLMKTAGAPGFESAFIPRGGQEQRRDVDRLRIPNAARHCARIHPRLLTKNLQIALIWFDQVGPAAKPSTVKTDEITLIVLIRYDSPLPFHSFRHAVSSLRSRQFRFDHFDPLCFLPAFPSFRSPAVSSFRSRKILGALQSPIRSVLP